MLRNARFARGIFPSSRGGCASCYVHWHILCAVEFVLWLAAARTAPVGGKVLERDAVVLGRIVHIAADGADVLSCRRLEHDFARRDDGGRICEVNDPVLFQTFQRLRRVRSEPDGRTRRAERATTVQRFAGGGLVVIDHGKLVPVERDIRVGYVAMDEVEEPDLHQIAFP